MNISKLQLTDICYNAEFECFETKVTIQDEGEIFVYPVHVDAPITADFKLIARGLMEKAQRRHRSSDKGMHLHFPASLLNAPHQHHAA